MLDALLACAFVVCCFMQIAAVFSLFWFLAKSLNR